MQPSTIPQAPGCTSTALQIPLSHLALVQTPSPDVPCLPAEDPRSHPATGLKIRTGEQKPTHFGLNFRNISEEMICTLYKTNQRANLGEFFICSFPSPFRDWSALNPFLFFSAVRKGAGYKVTTAFPAGSHIPVYHQKSKSPSFHIQTPDLHRNYYYAIHIRELCTYWDNIYLLSQKSLTVQVTENSCKWSKNYYFNIIMFYIGLGFLWAQHINSYNTS